MRYYAIFDPEDETRTPRNLFVVERRDDLVAMVILDRAEGRWVSHPGLIEYLFGEKADRCMPLDETAARHLAQRLGTVLPGAAEVERLARG